MKNLLLVTVLLFSTLLLKGQSVVISDSMYLEISQYITTGTTSPAQKYYTKVRVKKFRNGDEHMTVEQMGDSTTVQNKIIRDYLNNFRSYSYPAISSITMKPDVMKYRREVNRELKKIGHPDLNTLVQSIYESQLIGGVSLRINRDSSLSGDIVKNQQGNLRLLFSNKGYRIEMISPEVISVVGYPTKDDETWLFKIKTNTFSDLEQDFILILLQNQN